MSFVGFNCPECKQRIEAPPETVDYDFQCPTCEAVFVPSDVSNLDFISNNQPAKQSFTKANAKLLSVVSLGAFVLAGLGVLAGLAEAIANKTALALDCYYIAGGLFALGFLLCVLAQLLHIRAALEDLSGE